MNVVTLLPAAYDYDRDRRLRAMFEEAAIGIAICQLDGQILEANPALSRLLGYSLQELAAGHADALALEHGHACHPSPEQGSTERAPTDYAGSDDRWLGELIRGDRSSLEIERRYRRKDGSELWGHLTVSIGRDARRDPAFLIALVEDATERKRIQEHLREAEKMEVIGRLAGGIAHDFNNLLTGILLYCDLLSAGLEKDCPGNGEFDGAAVEGGRSTANELSQHVKEVRLAGEHGAALTQQLLAIARKQSAEPRPVRINDVVAATKNLLQRLIGEQIELVVVFDEVLIDSELESDARLVLVDPAQLRQILLNLVLNARDAMPRGGKIKLSTRAAKFPREAGVARAAVALAVTDTGSGMDATTRARLFEPFFTTKDPGVGTGLGLATVQRIVSAAGGMIEVQSELGRGTSIEVFLPALDSRTRIASLPESSDEAGASRKAD